MDGKQEDQSKRSTNEGLDGVGIKVCPFLSEPANEDGKILFGRFDVLKAVFNSTAHPGPGLSRWQTSPCAEVVKITRSTASCSAGLKAF